MTPADQKRGRPPLPQERRKRNNVTLRLRDELKQRLAEQADANGRSLSEEMEYRLEFSITKAKELADGAERCVVTEVTCRRCRMSFRAAAPANSHNGDITICAEAGCSVPFWHRGAWRGPAKVGVYPADVVAHRDSWLSDIEAEDAT
tara:strand:+ start:711 stop:1151 length:441 start_codon:yes stop_codon:yes gene_type:complete